MSKAVGYPNRLSCHICAAHFHDDSQMAEHMVGDARENERLRHERHAALVQAGELREILEELRSDTD